MGASHVGGHRPTNAAQPLAAVCASLVLRGALEVGGGDLSFRAGRAIVARSIPRRWASARTAGIALTRADRGATAFGVATAAGGAVRPGSRPTSAPVSSAPSPANSTSASPMATRSPGLPWISATRPRSGAGISTTALSVSTETSGWSATTSLARRNVPFDDFGLCQAFAQIGQTEGCSRNSSARRAAARIRATRRHVELLQPRQRHDRVVARHALDRREQREQAAFGEARGDLAAEARRSAAPRGRSRSARCCSTEARIVASSSGFRVATSITSASTPSAASASAASRVSRIMAPQRDQGDVAALAAARRQRSSGSAWPSSASSSCAAR